MKCPKCGKQLKIMKLQSGDQYGHYYSLAHAMSDKPMCDYNQKIKPSNSDGK